MKHPIDLHFNLEPILVDFDGYDGKERLCGDFIVCHNGPNRAFSMSVYIKHSFRGGLGNKRRLSQEGYGGDRFSNGR